MTTTEENFYVHLETKYDNKEKETNSGYKHYIDHTWSNFIFKFKFSSFRYSYTDRF